MRTPKYRKHSGRDRAFVEWQGKRTYLPGFYNSKESRDAYRKFIREQVHGDAPPLPSPHALSVAGLMVAFLDYATHRYGGDARSEYANCKHALTPLAKSEFGQTPAQDFGPKMLKRYRESLAAKHSRVYINQQTARIKRAFRWAVSEELVPAMVFHALSSVRGLYAGETLAKERPRRRGVPWDLVEATLEGLSALVADMVRIQWFTGVRSKSLCQAKPEQFDRTGELWMWTPRHKTEFLGRELVIPIGPKCQEVLRPYFDGRQPGDYMFAPKSQRNNPRYHERYTTTSYYQAIKRGIVRVNTKRLAEAAVLEIPKDKVPQLPHWFPHQMRHARGQEVREVYGVEGSQAILGHDSLDATQIYTSRRLELAKQIAKETG